MTIHLHIKHYKESGLTFIEYACVLFYEQRSDWSVLELQELLQLCERQVHRLRSKLTRIGVLRNIKRGVYELTDKLYK